MRETFDHVHSRPDLVVLNLHRYGAVMWFTEIFEYLQKAFVNILRALYNTFCNFIGAIIKYHYHNDIDKFWNESENVYRSCDIFNASRYFAEIIGIFKQSVIYCLR